MCVAYIHVTAPGVRRWSWAPVPKAGTLERKHTMETCICVPVMKQRLKAEDERGLDQDGD